MSLWPTQAEEASNVERPFEVALGGREVTEGRLYSPGSGEARASQYMSAVAPGEELGGGDTGVSHSPDPYPIKGEGSYGLRRVDCGALSE